jgi:hypothetical protein
MPVFTPVTDAASGISESAATLNGHWTGGTDDGFGFSVDAKFLWGFSAFDHETSEANYATENGSHSHALGPGDGLGRDRMIFFEFKARDQDGAFQGGGPLSFKTLADLMAFGTPHCSTTRDTEADVDIDFNPNCVFSTASLKVQYKLLAGAWPGTDGDTISSLNGTELTNRPFTITGLLANTTYQFRFVAVRDTANDTTATSAVGQFTTSADPSAVGDIIMMG